MENARKWNLRSIEINAHMQITRTAIVIPMHVNFLLLFFLLAFFYSFIINYLQRSDFILLRGLLTITKSRNHENANFIYITVFKIIFDFRFSNLEREIYFLSRSSETKHKF